MASPSSWMQSFVSPAKNWFSAQRMKSLSKRLRSYGFALGSVLTGMKEKEQSINSLLEEEEANHLRIESVRDIGEVEKIIGYKFNDQMLLQQAFTHISYQDKCVSYERLEYVGDSVLNLLITKEQFFKYQNLPPGLLTPLRAANVDTEKLARVAVKNNFHKYLRHGKPVLSKQIHTFISALPDYPLHSHGLIDAPKVLADIVESTIGAVFIDSNSSIDNTWQVAKGLLEPIITPEMLQTNPVKKLFEMCQKHRLKVKLKDLWLQEGAYEIFVNNQLRGRGEYPAKKEIALNRAADDACNKIIRSLYAKEAVNNGY